MTLALERILVAVQIHPDPYNRMKMMTMRDFEVQLRNVSLCSSWPFKIVGAEWISSAKEYQSFPELVQIAKFPPR